MQITKNFTLEEMLYSSIAQEKYEDGDRKFKDFQTIVAESCQIIDNMKNFLEQIVQPVRDYLEVPINITSGYRNPILNKYVRSKKTSKHLFGLAIDCKISEKHEIKREIREELDPERFGKNNNYLLMKGFIKFNKFDKLIHECGHINCPEWVHVDSNQDMTTNRKLIYLYGHYTNWNYRRIN